MGDVESDDESMGYMMKMENLSVMNEGKLESNKGLFYESDSSMEWYCSDESMDWENLEDSDEMATLQCALTLKSEGENDDNEEFDTLQTEPLPYIRGVQFPSEPPSTIIFNPQSKASARPLLYLP